MLRLLEAKRAVGYLCTGHAESLTVREQHFRAWAQALEIEVSQIFRDVSRAAPYHRGELLAAVAEAVIANQPLLIMHPHDLDKDPDRFKRVVDLAKRFGAEILVLPAAETPDKYCIATGAADVRKAILKDIKRQQEPKKPAATSA